MPESCWVDLDGPLHYVDHGGPAGAPLVVLVHGLGGSHANWAAFAPLLTDRYRVLAPDLAGFGLSAGRPRSSRVEANRELLHRFLAEVAGEPVVLIGNSMGGLISALQAADEPATVRAAVLLNPALPFTAAIPDRLTLSTFLMLGLPPWLRRQVLKRQGPMTTEQATRRLLQLCTGDPDRIPDVVIEQHIALARARRSIPHIEADSMLAARSLGAIMARPRRYATMLARLTLPVLLLHGDTDRLIPVRAARRAAAANPAWRFEVATGIGHVPMMEAPRWTARLVRDWLPGALDPALRDDPSGVSGVSAPAPSR